MPIYSTIHDDATVTLELGEPDRMDGPIKLWRAQERWTKRPGEPAIESLGLMRVGAYDVNYLSQWYVQASWPLSWLLKAYYWPFWRYLFWRILVREILCRHLYLIAWPENGYMFRWHHDFRPYRWYRAIRRRLRA